MSATVTGIGFLGGVILGGLIWLATAWVGTRTGLLVLSNDLRAAGLIIYSTAMGYACARAAYEEWR